jgi:hypothetical protein
MRMTDIQAITKPGHYLDGSVVPNFRKGESMKTKKPEPNSKGQQKRQRGPKC